MKVCTLIPVFMNDNCRKINLRNLNKLKKTEFKLVDEVVICDQCFIESDYIEGFTYLGPFGQFKYKAADARNKLFEWFYNSDYDYAVLMDARENLSKAGLNSFATVMDLIHNDKISLDFIQGTMGLIANTQRIADKTRPDYKENLYIRKTNTFQPHIHHTIISNFKKKYGIELYLQADKMGAASGAKDRVPEDIYFCKLCQVYFDTYLIGEMCVNCGSFSASTWADKKGTQVQAKKFYKDAEELITKVYTPEWVNKKWDAKTLIYPRIELYKEFLSEYKPQNKKNDIVNNNKVKLF